MHDPAVLLERLGAMPSSDQRRTMLRSFIAADASQAPKLESP